MAVGSALLLGLLLVAAAEARESPRSGGGASRAAQQAAAPAPRRQEPPKASSRQLDRRLLASQVPQPAASSAAPAAQANAALRFTKIATNRTYAPGTALNGSAFAPGACGSSPSALGYQCSWVAPGGAVLHWTYSTSGSSPPINRCTAQPSALPTPELAVLSSAEPVVHVALQVASPDKLHLVFVDDAGRVFPSEGVHGRAAAPCKGPECTHASSPQVEVLFHSAPRASEVTARHSAASPGLMDGWAGWVSADYDGNTQVVCLSRQLHTELMRLGPQLGTRLTLSFAISDAANYFSRASQRGVVSLDLTTGKVAQLPPPLGLIALHGALMLLAFGVLLPAGLLVARHRWLFVHEDWGLSPWWSLTHLVLLVLCVCCGLISMVLVVVRFGSSSSSSMVTSTHEVLGLLCIGLSVLLVVMYGLRPFLRASRPRHAPSPLLGPQKVGGVVTVLASWASLFLGCSTVHTNWAVPLAVYLAPCIAVTAALAAAATLLELRYQQLLRSGSYDPRTATLTNTGPRMPLRVRTHREPSEGKAAPGSSGDSSAADTPTDGSPGVTATVHARPSNPLHQLLWREGDAAAGGRRGSAGGSGSSGGGAELYMRRPRQSTPSSGRCSEVQTGFPSSPRPRLGAPSTGAAQTDSV